MKHLRWGILATGKIAHHFCNDLLLLGERHILQAVASRSNEKAKIFAEKYGAVKYHASYESLLADEEVDIIYIATPHHLHEEWAIRSLEAGKHVLCEKPMGVNAAQTARIIETARKEKKFLMEALWSRFNPTIQAITKEIAQGRIGTLKHVNATFQFCATFDKTSRLFDPQLAGGATLDIGIYPVFLSYLLLGIPDHIASTGHLASTGVDQQVNTVLHYEHATSSLYWALDSVSPMNAVLSGTKGSITVHGRWHEADSYTIHMDTDNHIALPRLGKGYTHEIEACYDSIAQGLVENPLWTWQNSVELISILDEIRGQVGVKYPFE